MVIVDFNQVMISNLMMQLGNHTNIPLEEGLFRHMVINSLRSKVNCWSTLLNDCSISVTISPNGDVGDT